MRRLQRRCEELLSGIPLPEPFDLHALCRYAGSRRGRRVELWPLQGLSPEAPCGLWISIRETDYIVFEPNTSRLHAEHIILHELCHILSGHTLASGGGHSVLARLMPDIDPVAIRNTLGRVSYTTEQEREAELLASMIRTRCGHGPAADRHDADVLEQMASAFSRHGRAVTGPAGHHRPPVVPPR